MAARVLIAGCGDVGTALGRLLDRRGDTVWGLRRQPAGLPAFIRPLAADLGDPASLAVVPREVDAMVYCAAAPERSDAAYRATYPQGLRNLLAVLDAAGSSPDRLLFTSSTAVYGQDEGEWVDESSATVPTAFTGRRMLEAEAVVGAAGGVSVRFGGIYGPGRTRLITRARSDQPTASPERYSNRIHRDDCARVLAHLLDLGKPAAVYLAVDDRPAPVGSVIAFIRECLGLPPWTAAGAATGAALRGKRCSNRRLRATGFRFRYPTFRQGYGTLLDAS